MISSDAKIIADNLEDFIEVPDGIERLRKAVLILAASGKLVSQDLSEGTAEDLYHEIRKEHEGTVSKSVQKKKVASIHVINPEDHPFEIPETWKWVRLGDLIKIQTGKLDANASTPDGIYPFFTCANEPLKIDRFAYDSECVLLAGNGDFNVKYYKGKFEAYQRTYIIEGLKSISVGYLYLLVRLQSEKYKTNSLGSAMPYIRLAHITDAIVPLPPSAEQERIAQKVNDVMVKLDELQAKKHERDDSRIRLTKNTMHSLGLGNADIALKNLEELVKTSSDLKELERAVLTLAISGRLAPQDLRNETAEDLYLKIQDIRAKSGAKGVNEKMRAKIMAPISSKEIPFEIPKSWKWVRLGEVGEVATGKTPRTGVAENYNGNIPFIGPGDIKLGKVVSHSKLVTSIGASESEYARCGDVVMVCIGGTIGKTALVEKDVTFNQQINKISPILVTSEYLYYVLISGYFLSTIQDKTTGGATPILNLSRWSTCPIPLPPLTEQHRIVARVEKMMKLIHSLNPLLNKR